MGKRRDLTPNVRVLIDQYGLEPPLEQVPDLAVAAVVVLGVDAVDVAHEPRQVAAAGLDDEVVVITHQAIGKALGVEAIEAECQHVEQGGAVLVVFKDRLAPVTVRGQVIQRAGELEAEGAGHGRRLARVVAKGET